MVLLQDDSLSDILFLKSQRKKTNGLLGKSVFKVMPISEVSPEVRIFNSRFVDEIKNARTALAFEKSRLIVQGYNDEGKLSILTQAPTI